MEEYGKILIIAMPIFLGLVIFEKLYGIYKGEDNVPIMDGVSSISSGLSNTVKDVLGLSLTFLSYEWLASKVAIFHLEATFLAYLIGFIAIDFYGYWEHRWQHEINFFWNKHAIHHSSEEFNLACALRQPVSGFVNLFAFLLLPAAILGVPPIVIIVTLPIHLFMQFWYHTKHIKKMGIWENIIVTPSHHRVHHSINPEYVDKNYALIFIIWDKLFGTFQEELNHVPPVYGITRPSKSWNPIRISFQHLGLMIADSWRSNNWKDKLTIWFKPTGWRPKDFEVKYPVDKINDVYDFKKYESINSKNLTKWSVVQLFITILFVSYLFNNIAIIGLPNIFFYGLFIFLTIFSFTDLMDNNKYALVWESIRFVYAMGIILYFKDWFGLNDFFHLGNYVVISYLLISLMTTIYFVTFEFKKAKYVHLSKV